VSVYKQLHVSDPTHFATDLLNPSNTCKFDRHHNPRERMPMLHLVLGGHRRPIVPPAPVELQRSATPQAVTLGGICPSRLLHPARVAEVSCRPLPVTVARQDPRVTFTSSRRGLGLKIRSYFGAQSRARICGVFRCLPTRIPRVGFAISALKRQKALGHGPESRHVNLYPDRRLGPARENP
jgi:hypothetical protein